MAEKPICIKCRHYYITWDKVFPYGCRAMNFKSRQMPYLAVWESSGADCLSFAPKQPVEPQK